MLKNIRRRGIIFVLLLLYCSSISIMITSCKEDTSIKEDNSIKNENTISDSIIVTPANLTQHRDSLNWIQSFREFRDAVYQHDKAKAKLFFDFPVMNESNEIWYLVYQQNEKQISQLTDKIKPFTEADFDKYFHQLFPKKFIKSALKLRSEDINKKSEIQTVDLKDGNTTYKMYATVDRAQKMLTLNLSSDTEIKDENGEIQDGGEFNIIYIFNIIGKRSLKFKQVRLAG